MKCKPQVSQKICLGKKYNKCLQVIFCHVLFYAPPPRLLVNCKTEVVSKV